MNRLLSSLLFIVAFLPLAACQAEEPYKAGLQYEVLPEAVSTSDPSKVEIVEVFWYGCSHCFAFEPKVKAWLKQQADDVKFVGVPAVWHPSMRLHAKAYYTAKALKVFDKMNDVIFEAMNLKKQKLLNEAEIASLFVANGVSKERFSKVFNSGSIEMAVDLAEKKQARYRIQGTPELVVNGKFRISGRDAGGHAGMLKVASFLVDKERANLK
jgi:thiol:disulfide interchange protein DsbA